MYIILLMLTVAVSSISFLALKKRILYFLKKKNLTKQNYTGNQVLGSGGLLILIPCILAILPCFLISPSSLLPLFITMMLALAFCGMLDDLLGDSSSKGLIDHIGRLLDGSFSSGILKALTGGLIGFLLAWSEYHGWVYLILDAFVFALSVNTINLLDLKPGRAIKGFAATLLFIAIFAGFAQIHFILPVATVLVFYTKGEMEEIYMLGDTGSNLLGGILGFYGVLVLTITAKGILLAMLLFIHLFAEFCSLSTLIEGVPLLKKIDMLGRKQGER